MLIDSHCHLDRIDLTPYNGSIDQAIAAANEAGVAKILCISINLDNVEQVKDLADQHEGVYASVGVHPMEKDVEVTAEQLIALADHPKVIAIGETGLDYYYSQDQKAEQKRNFSAHLQAAAATKKPVVVHTRDARQDTLEIIAAESDPEVAGVLHCFTESWEMARQAMDMNFYISISGIVTFNNASALRDVVRQVPLDRLLVETDAPWLAPAPHRGKSNEPRFVREVAEYVADLKGVNVASLAKITTDNFNRLFRNHGG